MLLTIRNQVKTNYSKKMIKNSNLTFIGKETMHLIKKRRVKLCESVFFITFVPC